MEVRNQEFRFLLCSPPFEIIVIPPESIQMQTEPDEHLGPPGIQ